MWVVFNKLGRVFNPHFFDQGTSVSEGPDLKGDEIVLVGPVWILVGNSMNSVKSALI